MRVTTGKAKGRVLIAPKGLNTRPITSKIKEALFSSWQNIIAGSRFLDLFSGSGSMGIEALSRNAARVVFVEKDGNAVGIIKKNLSSCGFTDGYEVYRDDVFRRIDILRKNGEVFDIIYLDPPFTKDKIFLPVMEKLSAAGILAPNGVAAIRTVKEMTLPDIIGEFKKYKLKIYGISAVHFYCLNTESLV